MPRTRRLLLMRHAHAAPARLREEDFSRPLIAEGHLAALGRRAAVLDAAPELVICSAATRAVETLEALDLPPSISVMREEEVYRAGVQDLVGRLHAVQPTVLGVLLIGHMPTIEHLAIRLVGTGDPVGRFSPSALADLQIAGEWAALGPGSATLLAFHR